MKEKGLESWTSTRGGMRFSFIHHGIIYKGSRHIRYYNEMDFSSNSYSYYLCLNKQVGLGS